MQKLVEEFLKTNPGYLKKSPAKVASRLKLDCNYETINYISNIMKKVKLDNKQLSYSTTTTESHMDYNIFDAKECFIKEEDLIETKIQQGIKKYNLEREHLTKLALDKFIQTGNYDEAIDFINKLKTKEVTPSYKKPEHRPGNYIVLGCLHFPFVNKDFYKSVLKLVRYCPELEGIILAGDILDMSSISRHNKGLMPVLGYDLAREYKETNEFLDLLDEAIKENISTNGRKITKEYFSGNHEDWYYQWKKELDNSKLGSAGAMSPYDACFKHRGYTFQKDWKNARIKLGDLEIIHGIFTTVTSAQKHLNALKRNVLFFHTHRFNTHIEGSLEAFNCGWGGDKDAPVFGYMTDFQKETWRNGMAVVNLNEKGETNVTPIAYKEGLFFNNRLY